MCLLKHNLALFLCFIKVKHIASNLNSLFVLSDEIVTEKPSALNKLDKTIIVELYFVFPVKLLPIYSILCCFIGYNSNQT